MGEGAQALNEEDWYWHIAVRPEGQHWQLAAVTGGPKGLTIELGLLQSKAGSQLGTEAPAHIDAQASLSQSPTQQHESGNKQVNRTPLALQYTRTKHFDCRQHDDTDEPIYCGALAWGDIDGDGADDLLISRRLGWRLDDLRGDIGDLVVFGPAFEEFAKLPVSEYGYGFNLLYHEGSAIQINAGEKWPGTAKRLRLR